MRRSLLCCLIAVLAILPTHVESIRSNASLHNAWRAYASELEVLQGNAKSSASCKSLYSGTRGQREQYLIDAVTSAGLSGLEAAQFMAQCAHECATFNTMEEYASGRAYEGRKDLGNIHPGDGVRYKGRGYIQITGRSNYRTYGKIVGVDLENNPVRASEGAIAAKVALAYWNKIVRPRVSNFADTRSVTRLINGGYNGLSDRESKFAQYRQNCGAGSGGDNGLPYYIGARCSTVTGMCIDTSSTSCPRQTRSGLCPGPASIKCCPLDTSANGAGESCSGVSGTCIDTGKDSCPTGATLTGKCPGSASIRCCPSGR